MVNSLDEKIVDSGPDHVGIRLWQVYEAWKREFVERMNLAGHGWFSRP